MNYVNENHNIETGDNETRENYYSMIIDSTIGFSSNPFTEFIQKETIYQFNIREAKFKKYYDHPDYPYNRALFMNIDPSLIPLQVQVDRV